MTSLETDHSIGMGTRTIRVNRRMHGTYFLKGQLLLPSRSNYNTPCTETRGKVRLREADGFVTQLGMSILGDTRCNGREYKIQMHFGLQTRSFKDTSTVQIHIGLTLKALIIWLP